MQLSLKKRLGNFCLFFQAYHKCLLYKTFILILPKFLLLKSIPLEILLLLANIKSFI